MGDVAEMEKPDHPSSANVGMRWTGLGTRALISFCASHIHEVKMSGNQPKEALWRNAMEYVRRHSDMHDLESPLQCRRKWCALADKLRAEMKKSALPEKQSRWEYFELMRRAYLETPNTIRTLSPDASLPFENENPMAVVSQSTLPFDADPHDESAASRIDQETILHHPIDMETRAENPSQAESGVLSTSGILFACKDFLSYDQRARLTYVIRILTWMCFDCIHKQV
eukprot:TRINITY_DN3368_c0_g1_i2.p1 TRINITY_DN3368_c0_g1~~TRINITY_DN3368_c0_g1_i2.p1  ORF type:complete len:227 (-),score=36.37 TRINITY_DN3368_c0_g1_i2:767-1447(-)